MRDAIRSQRRRNCARRTLKFQAHAAHQPEGLLGRIAGQARLEGRGNSVAKMLATADGEVGAVMGSGEMSNLVLELAGLDVAESLILTLSKDKTVPVRCAYTISRSPTALPRRDRWRSTRPTRSLSAAERLIWPMNASISSSRRAPRTSAQVSLRGPLDVDGTFKDLGFHPQPARLAGGSQPPPRCFRSLRRRLLALFETGPGKDLDCAGKTKAAWSGGRPAL